MKIDWKLVILICIWGAFLFWVFTNSSGHPNDDFDYRAGYGEMGE